MTLLRGTGEIFGWLAAILSVFFRARPVITCTAIATSAITQVVNLAAFFLPLKVILLAGSPGIPKYFQGFITQATRSGWLIGLTVAAVGAWILGLLLQDLSGRLAALGGRKVLAGANEIASARKFQQDARDFYGKFCEIAANLLFGLLVLVILLMISLPVLIAVLTVAAGLFLLTAAALGNRSLVDQNRLQRFISQDYGEYLQICGFVVFLGAFLALLYPFLVGAPANVLLSILCVLLLRQGIRFVGNSIRDLISLNFSRHVIDPLIFRDRRAERVESTSEQTLRVLFGKQERQVLVRDRLAEMVDGDSTLASSWEDSGIPGVFIFRIELTAGDRASGFMQHQVYPENQARLLEHEELLFRFVPRDQLLAPSVRARFQHGTFECQICDYGDGRTVAAADWPRAERAIHGHVWSVAPPHTLVSSYQTSREMLPDRLGETSLRRLEVAMDTREESDSLAAFFEALPRLRALLSSMPLCIVNPQINPGNVAVCGEGHLVMNWCRWQLEPMGCALPAKISDPELETMLASVRSGRGIGADAVDVARIRLVNACSELDHMIARLQYKKALVRMASILQSPLLQAA